MMKNSTSDSLKKNSLFNTLLRQLSEIKHYHKNHIWIAFILYTICATAYPLISVFVPRYIVDELTRPTINFEFILYLIFMMGGTMTIVGFFMNFLLQNYYCDFLHIRLAKLSDVYAKAACIDYEYVEDPNFEDRLEIASRTTSSDNFGFEGTYHVLFTMGSIILLITIYAILIGILSPWILLATSISTLLAILSSTLIKRYQYKNKDKLSRATRRKDYFKKTSMDFSYGKDIRLFGMKDRIIRSYNIESKGYLAVIRKFKNNEFLWGFLELLGIFISDAIAYYIIIDKGVNKAISMGELTMYLGVITLFTTALRTFASNISNLIEWLGYTRDYYEFVDNDSLISSGGDIKKICDDTLEIEFKNVSFKYPNTERYILKNFNFKINKKEKLAIVGLNGAGKTTIIKLITGMFKPTEGTILVNGRSIEEYDKKEYLKMFSAVYQEINIFPFTVLENVSMKKAKDTDVIKAKDALRRVGLLEKIESLPKGINSPMLKVIEDDGIELSGGQNQKLSIARALYKDANMIILDEPTASLDALAEAEIYEEFSDLVKDKTAIYVSHRLASTKFCDKIALFTDYGLAEYGSHDELMAKRGKYYEMFVVQGKYYQEGYSYEEN